MIVRWHEHTAREEVEKAGRERAMPRNSANYENVRLREVSRLHVRAGLCPHGRLGRAERFEVESADSDHLRADVVQEGVRARVDPIREVDGAGHAEYLRGACSREARIAPRRTYDAQRWPMRRERTLYKERDAAVLERMRRLEVLALQLQPAVF